MITSNRSIKNEGGNTFKLAVECDLSKLTEDQVKEYAFDAIWIKEQSRMRAMSNSALEAFKGSYKFIAEPKGTRSARITITPFQAIVAMVGQDRANKLIEKYETAEKVLEKLNSLL